MGGGMTSQDISAKRAELAGGKVGWRGLLSSKKTFGIALFASLGGLVYGCMIVFYNSTLMSNASEADVSRQPRNVRANFDHALIH
jgi:hypothetical protein